MAKAVFQELAQSRKCLLCRHKNPVQLPSIPCKSEVGWCFFNLRAQEQMWTGGCLGLAGGLGLLNQ